MTENMDLLLREILVEFRGMREKIDDIQDKMVKKDDFEKFKDEIQLRISEVEDEVDETTDKTELNTRFNNSINWGIRVFIVAIASVIVAGVSSFIHIGINTGNNTSVQMSNPNSNNLPSLNIPSDVAPKIHNH
jgi:hypothetical protein